MPDGKIEIEILKQQADYAKKTVLQVVLQVLKWCYKY